MKYILSIDGGGVKGVITAIFLERLEHFLCTEMKCKVSIKDLFDMFVGTSAGGIMALVFASGGTVGTCCAMYSLKNMKKSVDKSVWDKILPIQCQPKYDGIGLKKVIDEHMQDMKLNECKKPTLVVTYNLDKTEPIIYKSRKDDIHIRDLALVTSAGPTIYPCVKTLDKTWAIDGGVCANNPTMVAYVEGHNTWNKGKYGDEKDEFKILSLGTGYQKFKIEGENAKDWGMYGWVTNYLPEVLFAAPSQLIHRQCKQLLGDNYLRINSDLGKVSNEMDDISKENYAECVKLGNKWFDDNVDELRTFFDVPENHANPVPNQTTN